MSQLDILPYMEIFDRLQQNEHKVLVYRDVIKHGRHAKEQNQTKDNLYKIFTFVA